MFNITELENKAHIELIELAKQMGINRASHLEQKELIYRILDHQASHPEKSDASAPKSKRQHMKPQLLAESTVTADRRKEIEKSKAENRARKNEASAKQQNSVIAMPEVPEVPTVPDVLSPDGRFLLRRQEAAKQQERVEESKGQKAEESIIQKVEESSATQSPGISAPQAPESQPAKRKRGRPKKNQQPADQQPNTNSETGSRKSESPEGQKDEKSKSQKDGETSALQSPSNLATLQTQDLSLRDRRRHRGRRCP